MTELTTTNAAAYINTIRTSESIEELTQMIKQIDALKVALDSANAFRENAIKYAILEAEALLRVVELGGADKLRGYHKATAKWLAEMPEYERDKYIRMCGEGLTIDQVYKREVGDNLKLEQAINEAAIERENVLDEVKAHGIVDLHYYCDRVKTAIANPQMAQDIIDGTRNALRRAGAVGIGDSSLLYVMPTADNKDEVKKAVMMRYESVIKDLASIKEIATSADIALSYKEFIPALSTTARGENAYLVHLLIAFDRMGILADSGAMYETIEKSDYKVEMDSVARNFQIERDALVMAEYRAIQARKTATA